LREYVKLAGAAAREIADGYSDISWRELLGGRVLGGRLVRIANDLDAASPSYVTGALVEWLTDVLWHSIVFYAGIDPTTEELATQLSLMCGGSSPTRRVEPTLAVGAVSFKHLTEGMRDILDHGYERRFSRSRGGDRHCERDRFYASIARYLADSYRVWRDEHDETGSSPEWPIPMVLSTTYDLELEQALNDTSLTEFHVVIPVWEFQTRAEDQAGRGTLRWLAGSVRCDPGRKVARDLTWRDVGDLQEPRDSGDTLAGLQLRGPVVVKLNGSPLHELTHHAMVRPRSTDGLDATKAVGFPALHHAIVFSEFDHLKSATEWPLSGWLAAAVRDRNRHWAFLGQRLIDWNARMRLFFDLYYRNSDRRSPTRAAVAVNKRFDRERSLLLQWLGVKRVWGDLAEFAAYVDACAEECVSVRAVRL
jgi:hypothetical protein